MRTNTVRDSSVSAENLGVNLSGWSIDWHGLHVLKQFHFGSSEEMSEFCIEILFLGLAGSGHGISATEDVKTLDVLVDISNELENTQISASKVANAIESSYTKLRNNNDKH